MKNKITLGIDIDNTLTNNDTERKLFSEFFNVKLDETITDHWATYVVTPEQHKEFWSKNLKEIVTDSPLENNVLEMIKKEFVKNADSIYIITARPIEFYSETYNWLKENNVPFDKLIMNGGESKIKYIKELSINVMIDDQTSLFDDAFKDETASIDCEFVKILRPWNAITQNQHRTFDPKLNGFVPP